MTEVLVEYGEPLVKRHREIVSRLSSGQRALLRHTSKGHSSVRANAPSLSQRKWRLRCSRHRRPSYAKWSLLDRSGRDPWSVRRVCARRGSPYRSARSARPPTSSRHRARIRDRVAGNSVGRFASWADGAHPRGGTRTEARL